MEKSKTTLQNGILAKYAGAHTIGDYPNGDEEPSTLYFYGNESLVPLNWCRTHSDVSMKYHLSWDWLMPLVEKIVNTTKHETYPFELRLSTPDLGMTFRKVVEFVEWYNVNKKQLK